MRHKMTELIRRIIDTAYNVLLSVGLIATATTKSTIIFMVTNQMSLYLIAVIKNLYPESHATVRLTFTHKHMEDFGVQCLSPGHSLLLLG